MTETRKIICLANSIRRGRGDNRCIAGKECGTGAWIRPVSSRLGGELNIRERRCKDGREPEVMDILEIFLESKPDEPPHQPENWVVDTQPRWERQRQVMSWDELVALVDKPVEDLWFDGSGYKDRIGRHEAKGKLEGKGSLRLIHVNKLTIHVEENTNRYGEQYIQVKADFCHAGDQYSLSVTDPNYEEWMVGEHLLGESCLTISIPGTPTKGGFYHKIVAAIIEKERFQNG